MPQRRIIHVISHIDRSKTLEASFTELSRIKYKQHVVLLHAHRGEILNVLEKSGIATTYIPYLGKSDLLKVIFSLYRLFRKEKPDIVHAQLFDACYAGLLAAKMAKVPVRIHTRHHSTFHHAYFPKAVRHDRKINSRSTKIIAVSDVVKRVLTLKEGVDPEKVTVIHHGLKASLFIKDEQIKVAQLKKYGLKEGQWKIGVISRFTDWKGLEYVFNAFKEVLVKMPDAVLLLGNANGDKKEEYLRILDTLPKDSWRILEFEPDPRAVYSLFDVFVHVPVDEEAEAFGQVYLESMLFGIPGVFTLSGIASSLMKDHENALVVPYRSAESIAEALIALKSDYTLYQKIARNARISVEGKFTEEKMIQDLETFYDAC